MLPQMSSLKGLFESLCFPSIFSPFYFQDIFLFRKNYIWLDRWRKPEYRGLNWLWWGKADSRIQMLSPQSLIPRRPLHIILACTLSLFSRVQLCATPWTAACQAPLSVGSPGKNTGVGCHALLQGIFPAQGSNPRLLCLPLCEVGSLPLAPAWKASHYSYTN